MYASSSGTEGSPSVRDNTAAIDVHAKKATRAQGNARSMTALAYGETLIKALPAG